MSLRRIGERLTPQPLIAGCTATAAGLLLIARWQVPALGPSTASVVLVLLAALAGSYKYPVHIQRATKVCMGTVPLYLLAVLVPPEYAAAAAFVGVFTGNWLVKAERDLYVSDIITDAACWAVLVFVGALVAGALLDASGHPFGLVAAGLTLWTGQILCCPLLFYPITHQHPLRIMRVFLGEAGITEGCQYVLGLLGALLATHYAWSLPLLLVPLIPLYLAFKSSKETRESTLAVLQSMADAVDLRDVYTGGHSHRVAEYAAQILNEMGIGGPEAELVVRAARIHDIGKIGIPDYVLLKDGRLTPEEQALMEMHPESGAQLLARYPDFSKGIEIVRHHHERWDGRGYPHRLRGTQIPFGARVVAVADSFDAMTSDRPYRKGMSLEQAATVLRTGRGCQWEEGVVDALLGALAANAVASTEEVRQPSTGIIGTVAALAHVSAG